LKEENPDWDAEALHHNIRIWLRKQNQQTDEEIVKQKEIYKLEAQIELAIHRDMPYKKYSERLKELRDGGAK